MAELTVGSLFSGIGGLDLGLERAGMRVIWQSEIDPYACRVLKKHWPAVVNHGNIKEINWQKIERPDVICGGYPCQPFSTAGKRKGEEDPRHLWPWVRQAISELRPRYAILENVRGHLSLGGLSVIGELASIGYDAEWRVVSAASVGANHRRDRIIIVAYPHNARPHRKTVYPAEAELDAFSWIGRRGENVAYANSGNKTDGRQCEDVPSKSGGGGNDRGRSGNNSWQVSLGGTGESSTDVADSDNTGNGTSRHGIDKQRSEVEQGRSIFAQCGVSGCCQDVADTDSQGRQRCSELQKTVSERSGFDKPSSVARWGAHWEFEPDVGRVAHGVPNRVDRLKGLGNAVVPQVAEVIGRLVVAHAEERP